VRLCNRSLKKSKCVIACSITLCCACFSTEFGKCSTSPDNHMINYYFAKGLMKRALHSKNSCFLPWVTNKEYLITILKYFDGSQLVKNKQQKTITRWILILTRDSNLASPSRWRDAGCGCCCSSAGTGLASCWQVKALKRQQRIKIHPIKKAYDNTQESQVIQSSRIQNC